MAALVNISEAARLAGVSRQTLYKRYITPGVLSVVKDREAPVIDVAELIRVFGELKGPNGIHQAPQANPLALEAELNAVRRQLAEKDSLLRDATEREAWLRGHVVEITGVLRLLEHKGNTDQVQQLQDELRRIKRAGQRQLDSLQQALETEKNKGFWSRLFNWGGNP
jgi:hypothetical protein